MLGVFKAIFLNLFLLLGMGGLALAANSSHVRNTKAHDGAKSSEYAYSPFGVTIQATGIYAGTNRYRFSTKPQEKESSLYYYGHRFLDVGNGRWLSKDPIEERGGVNLYGFVGNDGVNGVDYLGMIEKIQINAIRGIDSYIIETEGCSEEQRSLLKDALVRYLDDVSIMKNLMANLYGIDDFRKIFKINTDPIFLLQSYSLSVVSMMIDCSMGSVGSPFQGFVFLLS